MNEKGIVQQEGKKKQMDSDDDIVSPNLFIRIWREFLQLCMCIAGFVVKMMRAIWDMVRSLYCKVVVAVLRSSFAVMLVRLIVDKFGVLAVRNAWYDASKVTDHVDEGCMKPLKAKDWEMALLEYTIAMITDSTSTSRVPISQGLSEISRPVLVVTGDTDRLVPPWNAERVARTIPGATFEVIENCGHLPQEERVEEFLSVLERFLRRVLKLRMSRCSQQLYDESPLRIYTGGKDVANFAA